MRTTLLPMETLMSAKKANSQLPSAEQIYSAYLEGDRHEVCILLRHYLPRWSRDCLQGLSPSKARSWREELMADGEEKICRLFLEKKCDLSVTDGEHLISVVRLHVRKEMRKTMMFLTWDPCPPYFQLANYLEAGVRTQSVERLIDEAGPDEIIDKCFFAPDFERENEWHEFQEEFAAAFGRAADKRHWHIPSSLFFQGKTASVRGAARALQLRPSTLRYRLSILGMDVVRSASPNLRDLGLQFLENRWKSFAQKRISGHGNKGGNKLAA